MRCCGRSRAHVERRLAAAANALATAWRRLQLLADAAADGGAVLQPEQLDKERELLVGLRERLAAAQVRAAALQRRLAMRTCTPVRCCTCHSSVG